MIALALFLLFQATPATPTSPSDESPQIITTEIPLPYAQCRKAGRSVKDCKEEDKYIKDTDQQKLAKSMADNGWTCTQPNPTHITCTAPRRHHVQ